MKIILFLFFGFTFSTSVFSQEKVAKDSICEMVEPEAQAVFPAQYGNAADFITSKIKSDPEANQGRIFIVFDVDTNGIVSNPTVKNCIDPVLENELKRVMLLMPKWKPATEFGRPKKCRMIVPVNLGMN